MLPTISNPIAGTSKQNCFPSESCQPHYLNHPDFPGHKLQNFPICFSSDVCPANKHKMELEIYKGSVKHRLSSPNVSVTHEEQAPRDPIVPYFHRRPDRPVRPHSSFHSKCRWRDLLRAEGQKDPVSHRKNIVRWSVHGFLPRHQQRTGSSMFCGQRG